MSDGLVARSGRVRSFTWVLVAAVMGCATSSAESGGGTPAAAQPEQVVHRMLPTQPSSAPAQESARAAAPASASGAGRATRSAPRAGSISSKHLEAELNRLEAELRR